MEIVLLSSEPNPYKLASIYNMFFFFFLTDNYILLIKIAIEIRIKLN